MLVMAANCRRQLTDVYMSLQIPVPIAASCSQGVILPFPIQLRISLNRQLYKQPLPVMRLRGNGVQIAVRKLLQELQVSLPTQGLVLTWWSKYFPCTTAAVCHIKQLLLFFTIHGVSASQEAH